MSKEPKKSPRNAGSKGLTICRCKSKLDCWIFINMKFFNQTILSNLNQSSTLLSSANPEPIQAFFFSFRSSLKLYLEYLIVLSAMLKNSLSLYQHLLTDLFLLHVMKINENGMRIADEFC